MEEVLLLVIVQLIVIITAARIAGSLFKRFGQPVVCGEIAAGLILGPSLFGKLFPAIFHSVFNPGADRILSILSQLGLILLMFLIGLEFDFGHLSENKRTALSVSLAGIVAPFALGFGLGRVMHGELGLSGSSIGFSLFMATAMSITAIPVLGRIMIELNINRTRVGSLTMAAAAMNDAAGWTILAFVTAIVRSTLDPVKMAVMAVSVVAYGIVMAFGVRPLLIKWANRTLLKGSDGDISLNALAALLIMVLLSAAITNKIGIFSIFGGFMMGAIMYDQREFREALQRRLNDFATAFFLPVFFAYTGLRTDMGSMRGGRLWLFCGLVLAAAIVGKFGGCTLAARANGVPAREASIIGVLMNTRGLMELIVINVGYDLGVIPKTVFFMLVFMAVCTTWMTTPILRRLIRGSEAWDSYRLSAFAARFALPEGNVGRPILAAAALSGGLVAQRTTSPQPQPTSAPPPPASEPAQYSK
jgi:Kef-type K+ transport system membrane component KefB